MYGDITKLEEMKQKYASVSPSFCLAKWMHVTLHLMTGHTHSCYLPPTHKIPLSEIRKDPSALHNTCHKKNQRKKMLEGERPEECRICWNVEDLPGNQVSDRHLRSVESWTMPYFDKVTQSAWNKNINPSYLEVSFSSTCNLKCSYCAPNVSSSWEKEVRELGPYKLSKNSHNSWNWVKLSSLAPLPEDKNPYIEAFWKWWPDLVKDLRTFRVTGGEPLLSKHTFRVFDWLKQHPQPHLSFEVNSNMSLPEVTTEKFIKLTRELIDSKSIANMMLHTSIDTFGDHAEYIRHGFNFSLFEKNIHRFLSENPTCSLGIMCTFNNLSVLKFNQFIDWVLELRQRFNNESRRILLDLPHLQFPLHQSARILTPELREKVLEIKQHLEKRSKETNLVLPMEIEKIRRIYEWMGSDMPEVELAQARKDFFLFFSEHDRRRGTNFLNTFPELKNFWELCSNPHSSRQQISPML